MSDPNLVFTAIKPGEFVVDYRRIEEFRDLSKKAIDSLTDILYNIGYTPIKCSIYISDEGTSCYEPRNAILFLDKHGKVIQYIELCFTCKRYFLSSAKIKNGIYCHQKFEMLKNYFLAQGINYGTSITD